MDLQFIGFFMSLVLIVYKGIYVSSHGMPSYFNNSTVTARGTYNPRLINVKDKTALSTVKNRRSVQLGQLKCPSWVHKKEKKAPKDISYFRQPQPYLKPVNTWIARPSQTCNGIENLTADIGIISAVLGIVSSAMGLITMVPSMKSAALAVFSTVVAFWIAVPSVVLAYLNFSDPFSIFLNMFLNIVGLFDVLYGIWSLDIGSSSITMSVMSQAIGIISVVLGIISGVPGFLEHVIHFSFKNLKGRSLISFIQGYRCSSTDTPLIDYQVPDNYNYYTTYIHDN